MLSNHLILCCSLLLLPSTFPSIRVFSKDSVLRIRWPKDCSFSFSISPSNEYPGLISFRTNQFDLLAVKGLSRVFSSTIVQKHQFFGAQLSLWSSSQCLNYCTVVLISHASRVMLKILQARFQQYMNQELLSNVQAGFGKFKWTRDQIANSFLITEKGREFQKKKKNWFDYASLTMLKPWTMWITTNWKILEEMEIPDHLTCLLRNLYAG